MSSHKPLKDDSQLILLPTPAIRRKAPGRYKIYNTDAFDWLKAAVPDSIHAVVTDPPYGLIEYTEKELTKLQNGKGGVWRIPPAFDGSMRMPLPRFTVLSESDQVSLREFFSTLAQCLLRVLVPGAHVFVATNPLVSHFVYEPFIGTGFEKRGEIIRTVYTLRGGDRPKNAHEEFNDVTVMPKSCWEPWGLFRKPCEGRVQDNLRKWKTGGLRRISPDTPFRDLIHSSPTRRAEHQLAPHPSLKPQHFLRQLARAALPFEEGTVLDPFMGSGTTAIAAINKKRDYIGIEIASKYCEMARDRIKQHESQEKFFHRQSVIYLRRHINLGFLPK